MPSPWREKIAQLGAIAILELREDPLRRGAHVTESALTAALGGTHGCPGRDCHARVQERACGVSLSESVA